MKNKNNLPKLLIVLFALTFVLLTVTTISGARAALNDRLEENDVNMTVKNIGVTLLSSLDDKEYTEVNTKTWDSGKEEWVETNEEGSLFANTDLDISSDNTVYVKAANAGTIDEYVRMIVYKYWTSSDGEKDTDLSADYISIDGSGSGWTKGKDISNEKSVYYFNMPLSPDAEDAQFENETSALKLDISLDSGIKKNYKKTVTEKDGKTITKYEYQYDGKSFVIEVEVDGIQFHNADKAAKSAWGVSATVDGSYAITIGG